MAVSQREMARRWGVARATLNRAIKAGKISVNVDRSIDPSEMRRVFGEPRGPVRSGPPMPVETGDEAGRDAAVQAEIAALRAENAGLKALVAAQEANMEDLRASLKRLTAPPTGLRPSRAGWWPWRRYSPSQEA